MKTSVQKMDCTEIGAGGSTQEMQVPRLRFAPLGMTFVF